MELPLRSANHDPLQCYPYYGWSYENEYPNQIDVSEAMSYLTLDIIGNAGFHLNFGAVKGDPDSASVREAYSKLRLKKPLLCACVFSPCVAKQK